MSATTIPGFQSMSAASLGISSAADAFVRSANARLAVTAQLSANSSHCLLLISRFMDNSLFRCVRIASKERSSVLANVFAPEGRIFRDELAQHPYTFVRRKIDHFDSVFLQPIDAAAKIHGFAHDNGSDTKLANQSAAVPARGQRGHHDFVAIALVASRFAKRVCLAMNGRIAVLHSAVMSAR